MPAIKIISSIRKLSGNYKLEVSVEDIDNEVNKVTVNVKFNRNQPVPEPNEVDCKYVRTENKLRIFEGSLDFSSDAVGQDYSMTAIMKNRSGDLGKDTQTVTVKSSEVPV